MLFPDSSLPLWIDAAIICLIFAVVSTLLILFIRFILNKSVKIFPWLWRERPGRAKVKNEPIESQIYKRAGIKPDKVTVYGQNIFACDSNKKKIFIQTYLDSDGILLDYKDIVLFETVEDETASECDRLQIKIMTRKPGYSEIMLPYISSPADRSSYIYTSASQAVKDVIAVLESI